MAVHHGIKFNPTTSTTRSIKSASTSAIALVAASSDADATYFPEGEMVSVNSLSTALTKAGNNGNLAKVLNTIADQVSPTNLCVIRVANDAEDTDVVTALNKLTNAKTMFGFKPKILGIPGLESHATIAALGTVAKKLLGFGYFRPIGATQDAAITDREQYGDRELMALWPDFSDYDGQAIAAALGHRAYLDEYFGFQYSLENENINGVTGISHDVSWDISGVGTNAAALNNADITTIIRNNGFKFWGLRTMASDPLFAFEVATRTDQFLQETMTDGLVWAMGKPITKGLIKQIISTINAKFAELKIAGKIIDAVAWFEKEANPADQIASGKLVLKYKYTYCAPMESLDVNPEITSEFYINLFG